MNRTYLTLLLCWLSITASAIDILHITNLTDRNGLSQNTVRCMMQDSKGFIWMGTINGINRYNGKEFVMINHQTEPGMPFTDSRIRSITEDGHGYIWIRTFSNTMLCYDSRTEMFVDYDPDNESKIFPYITLASNGDVWLWGSKGCCRIRHANNKLTAWCPYATKEQNRSISFVREDSEQNIWIANKKELLLVANNKVIPQHKSPFVGVHEYKGQLFFVGHKSIAVYDAKSASFLPNIPLPIGPAKDTFRSCLLPNGLLMLANSSGMYAVNTQNRTMKPADTYFRGEKLPNADFIVDNQNNIWVYNMSGTLWRHRPDNTFQPLHLIPPHILSLINQERYSIYHDSRNIIWITTFGNGLFAIDPNNGQLVHYTASKELSTNYLMSVIEDHSGEIWVGSELAGAMKISLTNYPFDVFYPTPAGSSDRDNAVRLIYEDAGHRYWFGTRNGTLHVYDSQLHQSYNHRIKEGLPFCIAEDTLGHKWVGTKGGGLLIYSAQGDRMIEAYNLSDQAFQTPSSNNIFDMLRDSQNRMWIATFGGGLHLAEQQGGRLNFRQILLPNQEHNMMRSMIQDQTGMIWVTTDEGVIVFDPDELIRNENNYISLYPTTRSQASVSSNAVRIVFEDTKGRIWLGTTGGGLNLLIRNELLGQSTFQYYGSKNGLSNEMIQAIQEDNQGYIWVSTESGISKFDPQTERFENFSFAGNHHATIFNEQASWKRDNGELMFGSYNGIYMFDPTKIAYDTYAPQVLITELKINGNSVKPGEKDSPLTESITLTSQITLEHNQNSFNLECVLLNFHEPELNQYIYYLEGYEKNWNEISRNNVVTYRNVPPGTYRFKVKGCNSFGVWNETETSLQITILPPWWKSGWALFLYLVVASVVVFFSVRIMARMHRLNMAVEVEKQLTEYKLRFFTNISHEFRTPLTIIRGAIDNLSALSDMPAPANEPLKALGKSSNRLLRLIDQLLEFRRLQNNKMELKLERTDPAVFFSEIYQTFSEMAIKKKIEFLFEPDAPVQTLLLDRGKLDKIAYNLLSNAFKHTPEGGKIMMRLHTSEPNDTFTLSISNSGSGVPPEKRNLLFVRFEQIDYTSDGTGIGLHLTAELAKVHKGSVAYTDSEWGGACFTVSIPLSDKNYEPNDIVNNRLPAKTPPPIEPKPVLPEAIHTKEEAISAGELPNDGSLKAYKVMVVEDDEEVQRFIESQLLAYFTVCTATNGSEALKQVAEEQPDMVVCDVMMPKMDGFEFTKRLKSNFDTSHIPVILLTAYSSEEHRLEGIRSGADAYITKPFSVNYLLARIANLLEIRQSLRRKFNTEPGLMQSSITFTDKDKVFLDKLHEIIEENLDHSDFKIENAMQTLGMSRSSFFRKVKGVTGYAPNEYVRIIRMKKAAELLMESDLNISEISYKVGIADPFYLSKCFKAQFGKSPSQYRKQK